MARRIGEMACTNPRCSCDDVAVEVTDAGTWQAKCHRCGMPTFGKVGTRWRRDMEALVKLDDEAQPDDKPAATPPPPAPAAKPKRSPFDLGQLA